MALNTEECDKDTEEDVAEKQPLNQPETSQKDETANKDPSVPYYKLFRYATTTDKLYILLGTIFTILIGICQPYLLILFSEVTGDIVNYAASLFYRNVTSAETEIFNKKLYDSVYNFSIQTTILGLLTILLQYLSSVLFGYSALRQILKIRQEFLRKTLNQDIEWYDLNQTGDFAATFTENLAKIEEGIGDKVSIFLFYQTIFVVGIIWALVLGWKLALVCLISLPLSTIIMGFISWLSTKFSKQEMEAYSAAGSIAEEVFSAIRTVVAFNGQDKEIDRYEKHLIGARDNNIKKSLFSGFSNACLWFFVYACYSLSFWYGVGLIIEEKDLPEDKKVYTAGNMIAVFFSTLVASWNFGMGAPFLQVFGVASGAASKIFKVLDNEPKINQSLNNGKKLQSIRGNISFNNVFFNYPSRPDVEILKGLNLTIESGQSVALVGSSGCGKSTCIQLIQRFYDPLSGEVCVDNRDIKTLDLSWLRNQIGLVGQEPALFGTSISENIRYGRLTATQEDIEKAAKKAQVHQFIKSLPQGYDTVVGERGAQLSGGQKQRIAIARALVREPSILLLDEATSALDTTSEAEVQSALDSLSGECTTIIVAHRLSTIKNANKIIVFSEGKVVEEGSHNELISAKGAYYNLVQSRGGLNAEYTITEKQNFQNGIENRKESIIDTQKFEHRKSEVGYEKTDRGVIFKVIKMNSPEWPYILIGCIASILTGASLPVYSVVFGDLVGVLANQNSEDLRTDSNILCMYFVIIGIVSGIAYLAQIYAFGIAGEQLTLRVRKKLFSTMLHQEIGWYDRKDNGVGALCAKLSNDTSSIQGAAGMPIGTALNSVATLILANGFALYFEWRLALALLSFAPLIFLSIFFEQKILQGTLQANDKLLENSAKIAVETISNIRTVASLGCEKIFLEKYTEELLPYQRTCKRKSHFQGFILGLAKSLIFFAYAIGMTYGAKLIIEEGLEYGILFKVSECVIVGSWSIGNAFAFAPNFQKGISAANRFFKLVSRVPKIRNVAYPSVKPWEDANIEFSRVYFSYPTRTTVPVLRGLDLSIFSGKTVALVGESGCGKSTIIQLLERMYTPTSGEVTVDDADIKIMDMQNLRQHLGLVSQEPNLFDRTVAENIAYGDNSRTVTQAEVIEAAKNANIHNFIVSLPAGYETNLGSKGTQLSGGQKQRVAIARALVRNPKVLLLDEATSALDNESEKIVQEALELARKGRTCITIAHRLSTIQNADLICVLNKGKIVEMGTHSQLYEKRGHYFNFCKLQTHVA